MPEEDLYKCNLCDSHKTELGVLLDFKKSVEENFTFYSEEQRCALIMCWFTQYKLDERTLMIQSFKSTPTYKYKKQ